MNEKTTDHFAKYFIYLIQNEENRHKEVVESIRERIFKKFGPKIDSWVKIKIATQSGVCYERMKVVEYLECTIITGNRILLTFKCSDGHIGHRVITIRNKS